MDNEESQPLLTGTINYDVIQPGPCSDVMENPPIGVSQQHLVDDTRSGKKLPQFVAALSAALGALATGTVLGWSSPARSNLSYVTDDQFSWISALATLGAASICVPIGWIIDKIGRKLTMLLLIIPFTLGWILITTQVNVGMLYAGRFIVGLSGGAFCVTAPTYCNEIAQVSVRGTLGSFFQLLVTVGILYAYVLGSYVDFLVFNILCLIIPIIFGITFIFMPETPYYYLSKGRRSDALKSLVWLRGPQYDAESELDAIQQQIDASKNSQVSLLQSFTQKSVLKTMLICYSIMFFQQFSGINAVLFNVEEIFKSSGSEINSQMSSVIIGAIQVAATLLSTIIVDKLGRKILLLFSGFVMALCSVALGVYFYIKTEQADDELIKSLSWLPLTSLCLFIISFSLGYGPIPWMLAGELSTPEIKAIISSSAGVFNWLLAFLVTFTYKNMKDTMQEYGVFWFFASVMALSVVFVTVFVFETKGKSPDEIQRLLGANVPNNTQANGKSSLKS